MKKLNLSFLLIAVLFTTSMMQAQLKTYNNATNSDSFHDPDNWVPVGVPGEQNDVLIPQDEIINFGPFANGSANIKTLTVEDGAIVTKFGSGQMTINQSGVFAPTAELNILEGIVFAGPGGVTVNGQLNSIGPLSKGLRGHEVRITGSMNIQSPSEPFLLTDLTLHILPSGILTIEEGMIDVQFNTALVYNEGLLQKTAGTGTFIIDAPFQNSGTINIDSGSLRFNRDSTFAGGVYNINANGFIETTGSSTIDGSLTGQLDGPFIINSPFAVTNGQENYLNFSGPAGVVWRGGDINAAGGPGSTLVNNGLFTITGTSPNALQVRSNVIFRNDVEMHFNDTVTALSITQGGTLLNSAQGVLTVNDEFVAGISGGSSFLNEGLLQKTEGAGVARINGRLENNGGTIAVSNGSILLAGSTLTNGMYNIGVNGILYLGITSHIITGTLTGQLDGPIIIDSPISLTNNTENFFDFSGPTGIEWRGGSMTAAGAAGTVMVNKGLMNITNTGNLQTQLSAAAVFRNEGEVVFAEDISFGIGQASVFNNDEQGVMTLVDGVTINGSGPTGIVNNGIIQKITGAGTASLGFKLDENTETGSVIADSGTIIIQNSDFINNGIIGGSGTIVLPNGYMLEGTVAPGSSPGILTYSGNYQSTAATTLAIELDGLSSGTEYDVLAVTGTAALEGQLDITLGFQASLDDEFVILSALDITTCNLPTQVTTMYTNDTYTFDVICSDTAVTLLVSEVILNVQDQQLNDAVLYPNPTSGKITIDFGQAFENTFIVVTNMLGQVISSETISHQDRAEIEITGAPGIYFVTVSTSKNNAKNFRILKQ